MKHDKAMELVAALRSGKYEQGKGGLEKDGRFCCLGVACAISGVAERSGDPSAAGWAGSAAVRAASAGYVFYDDFFGVMPRSVQEYFGCRTSTCEFESSRSYPSLALANDCGMPFAEIADLIEQYWEGM